MIGSTFASESGFASLLLVVLAGVVGSCAPRDTPGLCRSQSDCDKSEACLVSRCRPRAEPVVAAETRRVVLEPRQVALLSSKAEGRVDDASVGFGRTAGGDQVLLLDFDTTLGPEAEIEGAFLLLEPSEKAPSPLGAVPIQVAAIREVWEREQVSWGRQPSMALPETVADATPHVPNGLRIEVTRLLKSTTPQHGIAVLASPSDPVGAFYATGLGADLPPRLELYLKTTSKPVPSASASASASGAPSGAVPPPGAAPSSHRSIRDRLRLPPAGSSMPPSTPRPRP